MFVINTIFMPMKESQGNLIKRLLLLFVRKRTMYQFTKVSLYHFIIIIIILDNACLSVVRQFRRERRKERRWKKEENPTLVLEGV